MKTSLRRYVGWFWREWLRPLALAAAIVFPLKSAVADWNYVPSGSMIPSILPGELVWINKLAYDLKVPFTTVHLAEWGNPQRGDVVVFYSPADGIRLVKRIVGLPGDVIESRDDHLFINGAPLAYAAFIGTAQRAGVPAGALLAEERLVPRSHPVMELPECSGPADLRAGAGAARPVLRDGRQPRQQPRLPLFWLRDARPHSGPGHHRGRLRRSRPLRAAALRAIRQRHPLGVCRALNQSAELAHVFRRNANGPARQTAIITL
jgi:signal peptidase I